MRDILTLYRHELRMAFRERSIVIGSVLMPLVLYPAILWLAFTGIMFVQGQTEGQVARIVVHNLAIVHPALSSALKVPDKFQIVAEPDARRAAELVRAGDVDVVIAFTPATGDAAALSGNFSATPTPSWPRNAGQLVSLAAFCPEAEATRKMDSSRTDARRDRRWWFTEPF